MIAEKIITLLIISVPLLFAITLHEAAHGWAALKLGDTTAERQGRISLNPRVHIDLLGTIILPITLYLLGGFLFGWAKPVPVDGRNLYKPRRDMAIIAIAGPMANLIMGIGWAIVFSINLHLLDIPALRQMSEAGVVLNMVLMLFNLLPIPPLDGSRIVSYALPRHLAYRYNQVEQYGLFILIFLIMVGGLKYLWPVVMGFSRALIALFS